MKRSASWSVLIYGIVLMVLGFFGYKNGKSLPSLYAGVGFGFLLVLSSWAIFLRKRFGAYAALFLTVALTAVFSYRYSVTGKNLPAVFAVLSGGMLVYLLIQCAKWRR